MFLFCLVFAMFCARLFICALWSPAGKGLTSWLSFVVSSVSLSLSHWYPGSGVVLDCIDSWSLHHYLLLLNFSIFYSMLFKKKKWCHDLKIAYWQMDTTRKRHNHRPTHGTVRKRDWCMYMYIWHNGNLTLRCLDIACLSSWADWFGFVP